MTVKRRIILSSIIGSVALSALSLSITLAWYASNDRLNIGAFEVQINGDHTLLISTSDDLTTFKESLTKEELNDVESFAPVSSMCKSRWMSEKGDTPMFYDNSSSNVTASGEPVIKPMKKGFYQQKIYLLSDFSYNVTLDTDQTSFLVNSEANQRKAEQLYKENKTLSVEEYKTALDNLLNCVRLSILVPEKDNYSYFIVDPYKKDNNDITYFGGRLDNDADGYYDTYECLSDGQVIEKETVYGEVLDRNKLLYDEPTGEPVVEKEEKYHFFGNSFEGDSKGSAYTYNEERTLNSLEEGEAIYAHEESFSYEDINRSDSRLLIPCQAGVPREIVVSIYLEGWDLDCINATMGSSFIDNISFKLAKGGVN